MAGKMALGGVVHICILVFLALAAVCVAVDLEDAGVSTGTHIPVYRQEAPAKSIDDILSEQQKSSRKGQNENHWSWVKGAGMGNRLLRQYLTLHSQQHLEPAPAWNDKLEARVLSRKGYGFYDEEQIKKDNQVNERLVEEALHGGFQTRDFVFVKDAVDLIYKAIVVASNDVCCEQTNVLTGHSISIDYLATMLINKIGGDIDKNYQALFCQRILSRQ